MKNTIGNNITLTLFGESHGKMIGAVLDGITPGIPVDEDYIRACLDRRRPLPGIGTARREADEFRIVSGVYRGFTTGAPLTVLIPNREADPAAYASTMTTPRPGHGDLPIHVKSKGFEDPAGGGHGSGRLTAPIVAAGAILLQALQSKGVLIGTHIARCGSMVDTPFSPSPAEEIRKLQQRNLPLISEDAEQPLVEEILAAAAEDDSIGGVLETAVTGLPAGLGEPWFDTVEGELAKAVFSIPAVKAVEFGAGFEYARMRGSEANDAYIMTASHEILTSTNHCGGVLGGLTTGMPLLFRSCIKPTPSIGKPQQTVDLQTGEPATLRIHGRHDPCILPRAAIVQTCVTALVLSDLLAGRYGIDYLRKES